MDLEDYITFVTGIVVGIIFGIVISIYLFDTHNKDKEIELEKYKIEMQIKHGDINIESENNMEEYINERIEEIYDTSKIRFVVKYLEPRIYEIDLSIGNEKRTVRHSQDSYMTWEDNFDMIRYAIDKKIASIYKKEE